MTPQARSRLATAASCVLLMSGISGCVTVSTGGVLPNKPNLSQAARINTQLGSKYAQEGLYNIAEKKLKLAISEEANYAPAYSALAYVYTETGKPDQAEQQYQHALELAPNDPDIQNNFGVFLCGQGKSAEAQRYFHLAVSNPDYSTPEAAWTNAGICPGTSQEDAQSDFLRALQNNPKFPAALKQMAIISFGRKQYLQARAFEQRYRAVATPGPDFLLLSAHTERALGHEAKAMNYERQLVQQYPDSPQANQLGSQQSR